jgi:lipopolysaccharide assembly protein A
MQVFIVFSLIFSVFIAFFAVQNAGVVAINLLWYTVSLSQAVVILCSALFGVLIMLPFDIARTIKNKLKVMELSGEIKRLKEEIKKTGEEKELISENPKTEEVVDTSENQKLY